MSVDEHPVSGTQCLFCNKDFFGTNSTTDDVACWEATWATHDGSVFSADAAGWESRQGRSFRSLRFGSSETRVLWTTLREIEGRSTAAFYGQR